jgi:hypothetical protein
VSRFLLKLVRRENGTKSVVSRKLCYPVCQSTRNLASRPDRYQGRIGPGRCKAGNLGLSVLADFVDGDNDGGQGFAGINEQGRHRRIAFKREGVLKPRGTCFYTGAVQLVLLAALTITGCNQNKTANNAPGGRTAASPSDSKAGVSQTAGSKDADACKLVTKAEAEAVMGERLKDSDSGPAFTRGGEICMYQSPDSLSARQVTARVESPNFDWTKFKEDKRIEGEKMQPKRGRIRQVPGLGRDPYFARQVLHVLTERGILTIIVFQDPADAAAGEETETKTEAAEKTLAEKAVPRM